ncbi:uncharacterized protein BDW70DRAFT_163170 [Aspergillus foveolatus]|uniref:uncharacterized protein n=1 Tax=Aspergillus foveolatus TaxID=210207 RepID=UPI003CCD74BC
MSNHTSSTTTQGSPTPISNGNVLVFRDKIPDNVLDDPFFSSTSFPSPGIASPEREPKASCDARTWRSTPIEIPDFYTTADQAIVKTCRSTAESSTSPGTRSSPANKEQPTPPPSRSSPDTQSGDQERTQDTPKPKGKEATKPYLSIAIPAWTDCGPMQQPPPSTTPRTVHVRPSPSRYPHLPLSPPLRAGPPSHSTREEDLLRELQMAHREIRHLRAELVKYQNSLVDAERDVNSLTELLKRDREAFTRLRDRIRVLEYAATFFSDSVRR